MTHTYLFAIGIMIVGIIDHWSPWVLFAFILVLGVCEYIDRFDGLDE